MCTKESQKEKSSQENDLLKAIESIKLKAGGRTCDLCDHLQDSFCFRPDNTPDDERVVVNLKAPACGYWVEMSKVKRRIK